MPARQLMTVDRYYELHGHEKRNWFELVEGELVLNEPTMLHNVVQATLFGELRNWACAAPGRGRACLPLDVRLNDINLFNPDIEWYREGRVPATYAPRPYSVPDLAVEVRSPSTWARDVGLKRTVYEAEGLPELWLVDTTAFEILVYRRSEPGRPRFDVALEVARGESLESPRLPGFTLALEELFTLD